MFRWRDVLHLRHQHLARAHALRLPPAGRRHAGNIEIIRPVSDVWRSNPTLKLLQPFTFFPALRTYLCRFWLWWPLSPTRSSSSSWADRACSPPPTACCSPWPCVTSAPSSFPPPGNIWMSCWCLKTFCCSKVRIFLLPLLIKKPIYPCLYLDLWFVGRGWWGNVKCGLSTKIL